MPRFPGGRERLRTAASVSLTVLAGLVLWVALVLPDELEFLTPSTFLRIPVEALVVVALAVFLPPRLRRTTVTASAGTTYAVWWG